MKVRSLNLALGSLDFETSFGLHLIFNLPFPRFGPLLLLRHAGEFPLPPHFQFWFGFGPVLLLRRFGRSRWEESSRLLIFNLILNCLHFEPYPGLLLQALLSVFGPVCLLRHASNLHFQPYF